MVRRGVRRRLSAALTALGLFLMVLNLHSVHQPTGWQADELMQSEEWIDIAKGGLQEGTGRKQTTLMFEFFYSVDGLPFVLPELEAVKFIHKTTLRLV